MAVELSFPSALDSATAAAVRALADQVEGRDGQPPLSDRALTRLTSSGVDHAVAHEGTGLVGYAQVEDGSAEVVIGEPAAAELLDAVPITEIWSHGQHSVLRSLLEERRFTQARVLHQLRRPASEEVAQPSVPASISVRGFRVGQDEQAWLAVNAAAFAHHPEQGSVTLDDLRALEAESWFSPDGFLLAWRADELLGYHWTKVHPDGNGEVYVLGVSPAAQGLGLGRVLLDVGLRHLADVGCPEVLLYVDESNEGAMHLYESNGFRRFDTDIQWTAQPDQTGTVSKM